VLCPKLCAKRAFSARGGHVHSPQLITTYTPLTSLIANSGGNPLVLRRKDELELALGPYLQTPAEQECPGWQKLLQAPQFLGSTLRLVHWPEQSVVPPGQTQAPAWQGTPEGQAALQPPQFFASLLTSVHTPLQAMVPPLHTHWPAWQGTPSGQTSPQPPQFFGSSWTAAQAGGSENGQGVVPDGHCPHLPFSHGVPGQALAQLPQWAGSVARLVHAGEVPAP
jgi:hypothetical protein